MKIGLLICGQMRTFSECASRLLKGFREGETTLDIFVVTEHTPYCKKHLENIYGNPSRQTIDKKSLRDVYGSRLKGVCFGEDFEEEWKGVVEKIRERCPGIRDTTLIRHAKQWFYRKKAAEMAKFSPETYDMVAIVRPDMYPVKPLTILKGEQMCVCDPKIRYPYDLWRCSEYAIWSRPEIMWKLASLIDIYGSYRVSDFPYDSERQFVSETQCSSHCKEIVPKEKQCGSKIRFFIRPMPNVEMEVSKTTYSSRQIINKVLESVKGNGVEEEKKSEKKAKESEKKV